MPFVLRDILKHGQKVLKFKRVSAKLLNHGATDMQAEQMGQNAAKQETPQDGAIKKNQPSAQQPATTVVNINFNLTPALFQSKHMKRIARQVAA